MAHTDTPRTKFFVPSIGSITHRRGLPASPLMPYSSPRIESSRPGAFEVLAHLALDGAVGVGDRRQVGFALHHEVAGEEPRGRERVGGVGQLVGKPQVGIPVGHGPTLSGD